MNAIKGTFVSDMKAVIKFPKIRFMPKKSNNFRNSNINGKIKAKHNVLVILYKFSFLGMLVKTNRIIGILNIDDKIWKRPPEGIRAEIFANAPTNNVYTKRFIIDLLCLK